MKGIELPLNTIIIMAIAVIVLLATASFFFKMWQTPRIEAQNAFSDGCAKYKNRDPQCNILSETEFDSIDTSSASEAFSTLGAACDYLYNGVFEDCKTACGCPVTTTV